MHLVQPSVKIIKQEPTEVGAYKVIERAARVCYKSEDRITESSYKQILANLQKNGHHSALEHGTIYLAIPARIQNWAYLFYMRNKFSRLRVAEDTAYITTNYRVILEHNRYDDLKFICAPTEHHYKRITVHFISDISVNREANRHRVNSINEESTIYCNYSKHKFGSELQVSKPVWLLDEEIAEANDRANQELPNISAIQKMCGEVQMKQDNAWKPIDYWLFANLVTEYCYMQLTRLGWPPKQARTILPLDTKSELIHTAYIDEWLNFFYWRCTEPAQQIKALSCELRELFIKEGYITEDQAYNPKKLIVY